MRYRRGKDGIKNDGSRKGESGLTEVWRKAYKAGTSDKDGLSSLRNQRELDGVPDMIDIRLLMSSKDELVLPREEIFTQNDLRSLILVPYLFPLIEYFSIFFFCGVVKLLASNRSDITSSNHLLTQTGTQQWAQYTSACTASYSW